MKIRDLLPQQEKAGEREAQCSSAMPEGWGFVLTALAVICFGLIMLYSTSYVTTKSAFFVKQLVFTGAGMIGFAVCVLVGYKRLSDWSLLLLILVTLLLIVPLFLPPINGARRWIKLGPISIQPSEFAKVVIVLYLSKFLSNRVLEMDSAPFFKVFVPGGMICGVAILLVFAGKDFGTTALLGCVFLVLMFVAGMRLIYLLPIIIAAPLTLYYYILYFDPERLGRLTTFMNPELVKEGEGYQLWHSLLALGSGNWLGVGLTESRLKLQYLPEDHTDFILAIVGEELGFVFILAVMVCYVLLLIMGMRISQKARTRQGMLAAFGMVAFIGIQATINIGVICGAFPTKGMPAPMISYGGSSLLTCMLACGVVFSVALDTAFPDYATAIWQKFMEKLKGIFRFTEEKNVTNG